MSVVREPVEADDPTLGSLVAAAAEEIERMDSTELVERITNGVTRREVSLRFDERSPRPHLEVGE